jgi:hypothetical protein
MSSALKRFAQWISAMGWTMSETARRIECSPTFVGYILDGVKAPGLRTACAIERVSSDWEHGPIRACEWVNDCPGDCNGAAPRRVKRARKKRNRG